MGGANILSAPLAYVQGASMLQNFLESQGMPKGALGDDILGKGAMGAGADVLSVPTDIEESSQNVPEIPTSIIESPWEGQEGGIAGLKQGGQLVKPGPGRQGYNGWESEFSTDWGGEAEPQGSPPGTDPGPGIVTESGGDASIAEQIAAQDRNRRQDLSDIITRGEAEKTEEWEKSEEAPWNKKTNWLKTLGTIAAIITGVAPILNLQVPAVIETAAQVNAFHNKAQFALDKYNQFNKTTYTLEGLYNKVKKVGDADQKLIAALPKGHPQRIQLEGLKETIDVPDRDGVNIKYTTEQITETNDANAEKVRLLRKYQEMEWAAYRAKLEQQEMEAKKQAYLAAFRQQYLMGPTAMAAAGGRVPAGYNTGGLSNLFKLKNV
jgi:hypothetical protein